MGDCDIRPSDVTNIPHIRAHLDMAPQTLLDALGFSGTDVPGMEFAILHQGILRVPTAPERQGLGSYSLRAAALRPWCAPVLRDQGTSVGIAWGCPWCPLPSHSIGISSQSH